MTTLAQMENELRAMRLTDGLVHRVMTMADREGCSPTERYMWLAWTAVNTLRAAQDEALRVAREAPPAPIEVALPMDALPEGFVANFPSDKIPHGWVHAPQFDTEEATKLGLVAAMKGAPAKK